MFDWWHDLPEIYEKNGLRMQKVGAKGRGLITLKSFRKDTLVANFKVVSHFFTPKINGENAFNDLEFLMKITGDKEAPSCGRVNDYSTVCKFVWKMLDAANSADPTGIEHYESKGEKTMTLSKTWYKRFFGGEELMPIDGPGMRHFTEHDMNFLLSEFPEYSKNDILRIIHMIMKTTKLIVFNRPDFSNTYPCVGQAFSAPFSRINHSCDCNLVYVVTSRSIMAYARKDIKKGEELTISYSEREKDMFDECLCGFCDVEPYRENALDLLTFVEKNLGKDVLDIDWKGMSVVTITVVLSYALPICLSQYIFSHDPKENTKFFKKYKSDLEKAANFCGISPATYLVNCLFGAAIAEHSHREKWKNIIQLFN